MCSVMESPLWVTGFWKAGPPTIVGALGWPWRRGCTAVPAVVDEMQEARSRVVLRPRRCWVKCDGDGLAG